MPVKEKISSDDADNVEKIDPKYAGWHKDNILAEKKRLSDEKYVTNYTKADKKNTKDEEDRVAEKNRKYKKNRIDKKDRKSKEDDLLSYDELISAGWKEEKHESNFSLLSKNLSDLDKDFKLFESKNLMWKRSIPSAITISNITSSGLVAMVWEKSSKSMEPQSNLLVIDKFGGEINDSDLISSPNSVVLHDRFFACIFPKPRRKLRCFSIIDKKWELWSEFLVQYGKTHPLLPSMMMSTFILSKTKRYG